MANLQFATRAQLLDAVAQTLDRDDLTNQIPGFLVLAESEISNDTEDLQSVVRATFTLDEDYENLPPDFSTPVALHLNGVQGNVEIRYRTPAVIEMLRQQTFSGTPQFYTIVGRQFWFDRTPNGEQAEIAYYPTIPPLVNDADTNDLLQSTPALYLYGTLKHSAPFLREDDRVALWDTLYMKTLTKYLHQQGRAKFGAGPLVARPRRRMP